MKSLKKLLMVLTVLGFIIVCRALPVSAAVDPYEQLGLHKSEVIYMFSYSIWSEQSYPINLTSLKGISKVKNSEKQVCPTVLNTKGKNTI